MRKEIMRGITLITLFTFAAQAHVEEAAVTDMNNPYISMDKVADKLVDKMVDRAVLASFTHSTDVDATTQSKPSHDATSAHANDAPATIECYTPVEDFMPRPFLNLRGGKSTVTGKRTGIKKTIMPFWKMVDGKLVSKKYPRWSMPGRKGLTTPGRGPPKEMQRGWEEYMQKKREDFLWANQPEVRCWLMAHTKATSGPFVGFNSKELYEPYHWEIKNHTIRTGGFRFGCKPQSYNMMYKEGLGPHHLMPPCGYKEYVNTGIYPMWPQAYTDNMGAKVGWGMGKFLEKGYPRPVDKIQIQMVNASVNRIEFIPEADVKKAARMGR